MATKELFFKVEKTLRALCVLGMFSSCQSPSQTDLNALTGISADADSASAGSPAIISVFSGNNQNGTVSTVLSNPLSVRVTDSSGVPVPNVAITFAVASGGGSIDTTPAVVNTDSAGIASAIARLGSTIGSQTYTATMPSGAISSVTFTVNSLAIPSYLKVVQLAGTTSIPDTGYYVGEVANYRAILVDGSGAFIKELASNWSIGGTLTPGNLAVIGGNPSKYANFSPTAVGSGTIQAIVNDSTLITANNIVSITATTGTLTVTQPLVADSMTLISGNTQTGTVGTNLAQNLVVKVVNVSNVAVPGVNVTFSVSSGGGQIITAQPVVTDSSGLASCVVKLGGVVGNTNTFLATMPSGSSTQVSFTATGTPGAPYAVGFVQHPSGGNTGATFSSQPTVEMRDSYGNRITSDSSTTVTLTVTPTFGQGTLSGSLTSTMSSGLATFTNVAYTFGGADTIATNIKLTATSSNGAVLTGNSNATTVGQIIAAAQCNVAAGWQTVDGGCKDLTSGVVWSATNTAVGDTNRTWHQTVWDATSSGSTAAEPWEIARGITTDGYDTSGAFVQSSGYDSNAASYCHDLIESGYSDWRLPTYNEAVKANTDGAWSSGALKNINVWLHTGTRSSTTAQYVWGSGTITTGGFTIAYAVKCVRNPPPAQLIVQQQVGGSTFGLGTNVAFPVQPIIRLADSTNSTVGYANNAVTLTVTSGSGQLCTTVTTTGVTSNCANSKTVNAVNGVATFSQLSYSGTGAVTLTASATGLTPVTLANFTVEATYPKANCLSVGGVWSNAPGGCKDSTTGLIYNHSTLNGYSNGAMYFNWHDYLWDQTSVAGNASTQKTTDNGRTNDYDFSSTYSSYNQIQGAYADNSPVNYCHSLKESGKDDWMPMPYEGGLYVLQVQGKSPTTYLDIGAINTNYHWTSLVYGANTSMAYVQYTATATNIAKTTSYPVMCTRREIPANIVITQQPAYATNCIFSGAYGSTPTFNSGCNGAGVAFATQPTVKIVDADGAGPLLLDASTVTFTVVPASDNTGGTGRLLRYGTGTQANKVIKAGTSLSVNASNGNVTYTGLAYENPNEKFRIRITATGSWNGTAYSIGPVYTNDLETAPIYAPTACKNASATFVSQFGGCHNTNTGGLVWTAVPGTTALSWSAAIWDSSNGDARKVLTSDGVTLEPTTTDMDAANAAGVGTDVDSRDVCHRLFFNGYYDWRMPTYAEMTAQLWVSGHNMMINQLYGVGGAYVWSSRTDPGTSANAYMMNSTTYAGAGNWYGAITKTYGGAHVVCVREPNATSLYMLPDIP